MQYFNNSMNNSVIKKLQVIINRNIITVRKSWPAQCANMDCPFAVLMLRVSRYLSDQG